MKEYRTVKKTRVEYHVLEAGVTAGADDNMRFTNINDADYAQHAMNFVENIKEELSCMNVENSEEGYKANGVIAENIMESLYKWHKGLTRIRSRPFFNKEK